jgi:hypothetical protein
VDESAIRALLERHWAASAAGDQDAEYDIYADDVVLDYPQSGERMRGRANLRAQRSHHPEHPSGFKVRKITGSGAVWVSEIVIAYGNQSYDSVSIMEFRGDKVFHETQYFAQPFPAAAWRAQWVERLPQ